LPGLPLRIGDTLSAAFDNFKEINYID
jgi:hypothetical protein